MPPLADTRETDAHARLSRCCLEPPPIACNDVAAATLKFDAVISMTGTVPAGGRCTSHSIFDVCVPVPPLAVAVTVMPDPLFTSARLATLYHAAAINFPVEPMTALIGCQRPPPTLVSPIANAVFTVVAELFVAVAMIKSCRAGLTGFVVGTAARALEPTEDKADSNVQRVANLSHRHATHL